MMNGASTRWDDIVFGAKHFAWYLLVASPWIIGGYVIGTLLR